MYNCSIYHKYSIALIIKIMFKISLIKSNLNVSKSPLYVKFRHIKIIITKIAS